MLQRQLIDRFCAQARGEGPFHIVRFAVALPKGRSSVAQAKLGEIVNEAKRTGVVQKAIERAGLRGVRVAAD